MRRAVSSCMFGLIVTLACYLTGLLEEAPALGGCVATMISLALILIRRRNGSLHI